MTVSGRNDVLAVGKSLGYLRAVCRWRDRVHAARYQQHRFVAVHWRGGVGNRGSAWPDSAHGDQLSRKMLRGETRKRAFFHCRADPRYVVRARYREMQSGVDEFGEVGR